MNYKRFQKKIQKFIVHIIVLKLVIIIVNFITNKVDLGFGVDWVAVSNVDNNVFFDVDENTGESSRIITIEFTNTDTLQETEVTITQGAGLTLASSDTVTADSDLVTADNG